MRSLEIHDRPEVFSPRSQGISMADREPTSVPPARADVPQRRNLQVPGFTLVLGLHPPGSALPRHEHDVPTICYVLRGGFIEHSTGEAVECPPATLKVMPAGEPHWNRFGHLETRGVRIDVDRERFQDVPAIFRALDERHRESGGRAGELARRLVAEFASGDEAGEVAVEGLALELVAELARAREGGRERIAPPWLAAAEELIGDRFRERLSVTEIARSVDVHPATLSRAYRRRFGCTVGERIRRLRVEHAARELLETSEPLSEVALRAGFYDQSHFTNLFRQVIGLTPGVYRARLGR
jgi:AraC family transcriptional regulator